MFVKVHLHTYRYTNIHIRVYMYKCICMYVYLCTVRTVEDLASQKVAVYFAQAVSFGAHAGIESNAVGGPCQCDVEVYMHSFPPT